MIFILLAVCFVLLAIIFHLCRKAAAERKRTKLFLSTTAHDLRSPLTNIKGFADLLLSGGQDGENSEKALSVISLEASRLASLTSRLVNDGEKIPVKQEIFGICELLRTIFLSLERKTLQKDIKVSFSFDDEDEIYVRSDKSLVHEALFNICDNAVKYCEDGNIYVNVDVTEEKAAISVANKTADSDFSGCFKAGFRGNSSVSGSGLGLYISKKLINSCGSDLSAEKKGDMISFSFSLPHIEG